MNKNRKRHTRRAYEVQESSSETENSAEIFGCNWVDCVTVCNSVGEKIKNPYLETIEINQVLVEFQLDAGSKGNILPLKCFQKLHTQPKLNKKIVYLRSYGGYLTSALGEVKLNCTYKGVEKTQKFTNVDKDEIPILGWKTCEELNLISQINNLDTKHSNPPKETSMKKSRTLLRTTKTFSRESEKYQVK